MNICSLLCIVVIKYRNMARYRNNRIIHEPPMFREFKPRNRVNKHSRLQFKILSINVPIANRVTSSIWQEV